jgi:predicted ArsR family transcriptional regulator
VQNATVTSEHQRHRALGSISRSRLLAVLRSSDGPAGVRALADAVGLHSNTAREHLDQLVDAGLVRREVAPAAGRGRPGLRYTAIAPDREADANAYRLLAAVLAAELAERPDTLDAATNAGEQWGRAAMQAVSGATASASPMDRLMRLLDEVGFRPEWSDASDEIRLRPCPFGSLALKRADVVCNVHLGLMRGALRAVDAPVDTVSLEPFVEPDLCVAHVGPRRVRR